MPEYTIHHGDIMIKFTGPEDRVVRVTGKATDVDWIYDKGWTGDCTCSKWPSRVVKLLLSSLILQS